MSYEDAPATTLLATACACCGRPLVDSISVETGVGPDCRKKYGYGEAQGVPDWITFWDLNQRWFDFGVEGGPDHDGDEGARKAANKLVHRVALGCASAAALAAHVSAVRALGFHKLAAKLADRAAAVSVEYDGDTLVVRAPFSVEFLGAARPIKGGRWEKSSKSWRFPVSEKPAVWTALRRAFPGSMARVPAGLVEIPAVQKAAA